MHRSCLELFNDIKGRALGTNPLGIRMYRYDTDVMDTPVSPTIPGYDMNVGMTSMS